MLTRWTIKPAATAKDPQRRLLLVQAAMTDVQSLIRRVGALCGRPKKERDGTRYNFSLYLQGIDEAGLAQLKAALKEMNPNAETEEGPAPAPTPAPAPVEIPKMMTPAPTPAPPPLSQPAADLGGAEGVFGAAPPGLAGFSAPPKPAPGVVPEAKAQTPAPPPPVRSDAGDGLISLFDESGRTPKPIPLQGPATPAQPIPLAPPPPATVQVPPAPEPIQLPPAPAPVQVVQPPPPAPAPAPAPAPSGGMTPGLQALAAKPVCGACSELLSWTTMDNFLVGAFNRFSHAAAASAASNPGELYNPLFLYGVPGTGKSHLLQAIARQLNTQFPDQKLWITSGPLLSTAAQVAVQTDQIQALKLYAQQAKALLIDDVHLVEAVDTTRGLLTEVLHQFLDNRKQVLMTSAYAPRLLGGFEQALSFRIAAGWSGDLKVPGPDKQADILQRAVKDAGFEVFGDVLNPLKEKLAGSLSELDVQVRRLRVLRELRQKAGQGTDLAELLGLLMTPETPSEASTAEEAQAGLCAPGGAPEGPNPVSLCFPAGAETHARWALRMVQETAAQNHWAFQYRAGTVFPYDPNQVFGTPFQLAAEIRRQGAPAALVLGPTPGTDLAGHEGEFRHAVSHLVADFGVRLSWISFLSIKDPFGHLKACLDMEPGA